MEPQIFTDEVIEVLRKSGWSEEREVNIKPYVDALEEQDFLVFPYVLDFLKSFGGMEIWFVNGRDVDEDITVDMSEDFNFSKANTDQCSQNFGVPLCPIGSNYYDYNTLFMDDTGNVYLMRLDGFYFCGATWQEAIQSMLYNNPLKRLEPLSIEAHTKGQTRAN